LGEDQSEAGQVGLPVPPEDLSKLESFVAFDELSYQLSCLRDIITKAETYSGYALLESADTRFEEMTVSMEKLWKGIEVLAGELGP
jgi:hypothetical protein